MQIYSDGRMPVCHFDTYRIGDLDEFLAIGAEEYLNDSDVVCLVEWAELVADALPDDRLNITIEQTARNMRRITLHAAGLIAESILDSKN